jgi:hypothetical protein
MEATSPLGKSDPSCSAQHKPVPRYAVPDAADDEHSHAGERQDRLSPPFFDEATPRRVANEDGSQPAECRGRFSVERWRRKSAGF